MNIFDYICIRIVEKSFVHDVDDDDVIAFAFVSRSHVSWNIN